MKNIIIISLLSLCLLTGCSTANSKATAPNNEQSSEGAVSDADIIEVSDKMFLTQVNNIYINREDYIGKTIRYEGIFKVQSPSDNQPPSFYALRYGPGCCGDDGNIGFEVLWDGETIEDDAWVEIVGKLQLIGSGATERLIVNASSLTVLPVRGEEFVSQ